jgi:hypothetical protein
MFSSRVKRAMLGGAFVLVCVTPAAAQPTTSDTAPLPKVFVGAGFGPATNDAASRMRLYEEGLATMWLIETGVGAAPRLGIGAEYSQPAAAKAFTTVGLGRAQISGRQEERVLLATVRGRVAGVGRWALDLMGGAGILFQHHASGGCVPAQTRCENSDGPVVEERAPAFAAGLEVPLRVASHFAVATSARLYALRRGDHTSATDINLTWQNEWQSSTRVALVVTGRAMW